MAWDRLNSTADGGRRFPKTLAEEGRCHLEFLGRDRAQLRHRLLEWNELNPGPTQRRHRPPPSLVRRVDRSHTETCGQHTVVRRRGPAALDVAEHDGARLKPRARLELVLEALPDPAKAKMSELIGPALRHLHRAGHGGGTLRHDHDREEPPSRMAAADQPADLVDVEWLLRDQDHISAPGQSRVKSDPAGVAPHHLDDHHAVV